MDDFNWRDKLFDSLSFPSLILSLDRKIVAANDKFLEKYQCSKEHVLGNACYKILYGFEKPCLEPVCPLLDVIKTKQGKSSVNKVIGRHGEGLYEDRVCSPIFNDRGDVADVLISIRDITSVKLLETECRRTRDFVEKIIESSISAIIVADMKGVILFMNESARKLFGYTTQVAVGKSIAEYLYTPGGARSIMKKLRSREYGGIGKLYTTNMTIITASGKSVPVEMNASIIYENGKEIASMGIYSDLRPRLKIEKKLREAERLKLAQSNKMASLGQLAAGVAHEINNPLSGILIDASLIMEELEEDNPLREDIKNIIEDTNRCKEIVKNLLAYSRQMEIKEETLDINSVVEQTFSLLQNHALLRNITIKKEFFEGMLLFNGDRNQLIQVFTNLIINAAQAIKDTGIITIKTDRDKPRRKIYIEISDTGCGIPDAILPKIFDLFFTTKEEGKGTGLGLGTVQGIIEKHGGKVKVKETSPRGTTFQITLPLFVVSRNTLF
jgi:two-component system, NtrC family, sensor kinase